MHGRQWWLLGLGVAMCGCTPHPGPTRDVTLVARGMTFVLEGQPESPNPVIRLRPGERVHLVLKNESPGLLHDVVIPGLGVEFQQIRAGEQREVTFLAPDAPGRFEYHCRPHARRMKGLVEVAH